MTLVCAPPGAGKSTLLASALAPCPTRRPPVAWLCLDERDNDAGRLVALLRSALSADGAAPVRARSAVPVLDQLDELLGGLAEGGADGARVLVLDDAHALRSPTALEVVAHLLHNAPAQLDIVLSSRADLPVGFEDLRLDGRLGEIRNAELAFSRSETSELLDLHDVTLAADDVYALWARTEGWAAGLRLASCALQTDPDPGRFVRSATRTASVMSDYLLRELLVRKDDDVQWFLLRTSVADRLTPELAVLLSDDPRAAEHLVELERSGILVVDHEDDRWHRYHALFGALLRARLNRHDTDLARELHGRAAQWFLEREMPSEAELHAQSACDWDLLGQLVAWRWIDATLEGHAIDGDLLPPGLEPTTVAEAPGLALIAAADACRRANHDEADLYRGALDDLVAQPAHAPAHCDGSEPFANERLVLDVVFGCAFGSDARSQAAAATLRTMAVADPCAVNLRRFGMLRGAELALDAGDVEQALVMLSDLADRAEHCWVTAEAMALLALLHAAVGRPALVGPLVDQVLGGASGCATALAACAARLATVLALAQRGELRSAADTLAGAAPAGGPVASRSLRTVHRVAGIGLSSVPGRPVALDAPSVGSPLAERALLALGVVEIVTPDGRPVPLGGPGEQAVKEARLRFISGEPERADLAVGPWLARVDGRIAHPRTLIEALAVAAIAAGARDDQVSARRCVAEALDLMDATGALAPLLHHGGRLAPLLQRNLSELGERMGAALLLLDRTRPTGAGELVEPLTDREMEVLIHLPTLMSNAEIASGLYLSVNTVKTHLKAVYRKLGVDGRRQAVVRGRELELI